jgi:hypothetical protein
MKQRFALLFARKSSMHTKRVPSLWDMRVEQRVLAFLHALAKQLPSESAAFPKRVENTTAKRPECSGSDSDYEEVPRKLRTRSRRGFDLNMS